MSTRRSTRAGALSSSLVAGHSSSPTVPVDDSRNDAEIDAPHVLRAAEQNGDNGGACEPLWRNVRQSVAFGGTTESAICSAAGGGGDAQCSCILCGNLCSAWPPSCSASHLLPFCRATMSQVAARVLLLKEKDLPTTNVAAPASTTVSDANAHADVDTTASCGDGGGSGGENDAASGRDNGKSDAAGRRVLCALCSDLVRRYDRLSRELRMKRRQLAGVCGRLRQVYAKARHIGHAASVASGTNHTLAEKPVLAAAVSDGDINQINDMDQVDVACGKRPPSRADSQVIEQDTHADKRQCHSPGQLVLPQVNFDCRVVISSKDIVKNCDEYLQRGDSQPSTIGDSAATAESDRVADEKTAAMVVLRPPPRLTLMVKRRTPPSASTAANPPSPSCAVDVAPESAISALPARSTASDTAAAAATAAAVRTMAPLKTLRPKPMVVVSHQSTGARITCSTSSLVAAPQAPAPVPPSVSQPATVVSGAAAAKQSAPLTVFRLPDGRLLMPAVTASSSAGGDQALTDGGGGGERLRSSVTVTRLAKADMRNLNVASLNATATATDDDGVGSGGVVTVRGCINSHRIINESLVRSNTILASILQQKSGSIACGSGGRGDGATVAGHTSAPVAGGVALVRPRCVSVRPTSMPSVPSTVAAAAKTSASAARRRTRRPVDAEPCPLCALYFGSRSEVDQHVRDHPLVCNQCQCRCGSRLELFEHRQRCRAGETAAAAVPRPPPSLDRPPAADGCGGDFMCDRCGATFRRIGQANGHALVFHKLPYRCPLCGRADRTLRAYEEHVRRQHGVRTPFPCNMCQATFVRATLLVRHFHSRHAAPRRHALSAVKIVSVSSEAAAAAAAPDDDGCVGAEAMTSAAAVCEVKLEKEADDDDGDAEAANDGAHNEAQHMVIVKQEVEDILASS